ncbi:TonB-dependent receptor [Arachidicoccus terrestris]|uniref:TonB-dependent receptor n=1 Tax=Arachidicoccus terrestris TaxID=2875539 RepID=UPI001CC552EF|nr:TonB-dependent receptor [Arachidicoccus terrestris]UAY56941.1 TonB-dependent receptor [Arachidicoccus terrestris]
MHMIASRQKWRRLKVYLNLCLCCGAFLLLLSGPRVMAQQAPEKLKLPVTLHEQQTPLLNVLRSLKKQTGLIFFYSNDVLDDGQLVTLDCKSKPVGEVLNMLFAKMPVQYTLKGDKILIVKKVKAPSLPKEKSPADLPAVDSNRIRGTVMDVDGKPIAGATVLVNGSNEGTLTDVLGAFAMAAKPGATITVSMVGMISQEVAVPEKGTMKVTLVAKPTIQNDVVVVGYGKQSKLTVTGAVSSVNMEDMQTSVPSLTNALAGKVAGVISVQSSGEPGYDNAQFTIRGIGTFTGNTSPLIIVDGVQRDDVNSSYGGSFNNIDPEDIASISLLKDASSTAMYGAKGANGVLIITTKRGIAGKPKISLKAETGLTGFTKTPEMLNGVEYMKLYNEARRNMGLAPAYSDEIIQKTASGLDPYMYPDVDWMKEVYGKSSSLTNVNLNVSGGSEAVRYYVSASFYNQDGPYNVKTLNDFNPNLNFKRYDFRTNLDINLTKSTILSMNLDAMLVNAKYPGISAGSLWYISYATTPVGFPVKFSDEKWAGPIGNGGSNPLNEVQNNGYSKEFRPTVQSVFTVNQKLDAITKGLSAYGRFSFDSYGEFDNRRARQNDLYAASGRDDNGQLVFVQTRFGQQFLNYSKSSTGERTMYLEGNINYDRRFGLHHVGAMVLYNMRNRLVSSAGDAVSSIPYRNQSLAGRLTYGYDERYLLELNAGYTGSENFEPGRKFGLFPSVSGGWVISREHFFKTLNNTISLLKLRASYGIVGNDNIGRGGRFPYITQITGGGTAGFGLNGSALGGLNESVIGVQDLTWEKSYKTDIGLEVGIKDRVSITLDYFKDDRKNLLIARKTLSSIAGYNNSAVYANLGKMNNRGLDGTIEYNDKIGELGLRVYANATYAKNRTVFEDEPIRKYGYQRSTGHMYGEFTGYIDEGLFVDADDISGHATQGFGVVAPGDIKYKNLNPEDDNVVDANDWTYLGKSPFPEWSYGAGFTVSWHNIDLSMLFQGVSGVGIMANGSEIRGNGAGADGVGVIPFSGIGQFPNNTMAILKDRWTAQDPRQDAYYPRITIGSLTDNNYLNSTRWLKSGDYMRLKQASIGYTVVSRKVKSAGLSSLYFYLSGQNLFTFSKFKLWDPELGSNGAKYPINRMITLGVRANF